MEHQSLTASVAAKLHSQPQASKSVKGRKKPRFAFIQQFTGVSSFSVFCCKPKSQQSKATSDNEAEPTQ
jgi:hypothetical protein